MKILIDNAIGAFIGYMSEQAAKVSKPFEKFTTQFLLESARLNNAGIVAKVRPWLEMSGVATDNMIDVDKFKAALDAAFSKVPSFTYLGWTFTPEDAAALVSRMRGQEVP